MIWVEGIAVIFGIICVWLTIRQSIWCWPAGLVQVTLFIVIFYRVKLYSDLILHLIYVVLQIYGWFYWLYGGKKGGTPPISVIPLSGRFSWIGGAILGTILWGYMMATYTDASVPYGDAFTTVASLIAQWLMARKKLESWLFWIVVDVVAIGIYWEKDLVLTAGLYTVFLILAAMGLLTWRKSMLKGDGEPI